MQSWNPELELEAKSSWVPIQNTFIIDKSIFFELDLWNVLYKVRSMLKNLQISCKVSYYNRSYNTFHYFLSIGHFLANFRHNTRNTFQRIENLDNVKEVEDLCLSHNIIEKIENLDHLKKLRILNLSFNLIGKIENISSLMVCNS